MGQMTSHIKAFWNSDAQPGMEGVWPSSSTQKQPMVEGEVRKGWFRGMFRSPQGELRKESI